MKIEMQEKSTGKVVTLTFVKDDLNKKYDSVVAFFVNNPDIQEIKLNFDSHLNLEERTALMSQLNSTLSNIKSLKRLVMEGTVKDYALEELLSIPVIQQLTQLELKHGKHDQKETFVNSIDFFERILADYLKKNPGLESLVIEDNHGNITSRGYPKLLSALRTQKGLKRFSQGLVDVMGDDDLISKNEALKLNLIENVVNTPQQKAAKLTKTLQNAREQFSEFTRYLEILTVTRPQIHPYENGWNNVITAAILRSANLKKLKKDLEETFGVTFSGIASINIDIAYTDLIRVVAELRYQSETNPALTPHLNKLEKFWDNTRKDLLADCIASQTIDSINIVLQKMKSLKNEFTLIKRDVNPVVYPDSYTELTQDYLKDSLERAKNLLQDYTKFDSAVSRFFHGHWNRHHVDEVSAIVKAIDAGTIQTIEQLVRQLKQDINPENPNGSIAKRISFIETKLLNDYEYLQVATASM